MLTTRFTVSSRIRKSASLRTANPPTALFSAQKMESTVRKQNRASGSLTGGKAIFGLEWARRRQRKYSSVARARKNWAAAIDNQKVSTEALKKREAHCANGSGGSAARADEK